MLQEGNTNINRVCDGGDDQMINVRDNGNCIRVSPIVIDAQQQLLEINKNDVKTDDTVTVTSHFHLIGSKSDKFPEFDRINNKIDTVADN